MNNALAKKEAAANALSEAKRAYSQSAQTNELAASAVKKDRVISGLYFLASVLAVLALSMGVKLPYSAMITMMFIATVSRLWEMMQPVELDTEGARTFFDFLTEVFLLIYPILLTVVLFLAVRALVLAFRHNLDIFMEMGSKKTSQKAIQSLVLWAAIFTIPLSIGYAIDNYIDKIVNNQIYNIKCSREGDGLTACEEDGSGGLAVVVNSDQNRDTVEADINTAAQSTIDLQFDGFDSKIETMRDALEKRQGEAREIAETQYKNVFKDNLWDLSPAFAIPGCRWYQALCKIERAIKKSINRKYVRARIKGRNFLLSEIDRLGGDLSDLVGQETNKLSNLLHKSRLDIKAAVKTKISEFFHVLSVIGLLGLLTFFIAALKSYLYIFGRVLFTGNESHYFSVLPPDHQTVTNSGMHLDATLGTNVNIQVDPSSDLCTKSGLAAGAIHILPYFPEKLVGTLGRIFSGIYFFGRPILNRTIDSR